MKDLKKKCHQCFSLEKPPEQWVSVGSSRLQTTAKSHSGLTSYHHINVTLSIFMDPICIVHYWIMNDVELCVSVCCQVIMCGRTAWTSVRSGKILPAAAVGTDWSRWSAEPPDSISAAWLTRWWARPITSPPRSCCAQVCTPPQHVRVYKNIHFLILMDSYFEEPKLILRSQELIFQSVLRYVPPI